MNILALETATLSVLIMVDPLDRRNLVMLIVSDDGSIDVPPMTLPLSELRKFLEAVNATR